MLKKSLLFCLLFIAILAPAQQITLDEHFEDWDQLSPAHVDPLDDAPFLGIDFDKLWVDDDDEYLYISFELTSKLILQDPSELSIYLDLDNNASTGQSVDNIGAELQYNFGDRDGTLTFNNGNSFFIDHFNIGFVSLPTVSAERFEIKMNRNMNASGQSLSIGETIKIIMRDNRTDGDRLPDGLDGLSYTLKNKSQVIPAYPIGKENSDQLRILSYNVERDNYFKFNGKAAIQRILTATQPDIIAFQEIYDNSSLATANQVEEVLSATNGWFHAKVNPDIILVSRYPITDQTGIANDGNGAFVVDVNGQDLLLINVHLPCCDNNSGRIEEVSNIVSFIDATKAGNTSINIEANTPIIILGDTNFVGHSEQVDLAKNGVNGDLDWGQPLTDAKPLTTGEPQTFTWYNPFSSYCPGRLDYILYTKSQLTKKNNFVLFTESMTTTELNSLNLDRSDTSDGSDHLPVICDFTFMPTVSTEENTFADRIELYPNPAQNLVYLKNIGLHSFVLEIIDTHGRLISKHQIDSDNYTIETTSLTEGIYHLRLNYPKSTITKRLIIQR